MLDERKAQKKVRELEKELIAMLLVLASRFDTNGKRVVLNERNMRLADMTTTFNKFNKDLQVPFLRETLKDLKAVKGELDDYYKSLGLTGFAVSHKKIGLLNKQVGKYMGEFALSTQVKMEVQGILTSGISSNISPTAMATSIRKDVKGKLEKYYQQFMWDEIVQIERIENNFYA